MDTLAHLGRASDRVRRPAERREEPVPGRVELATVVPPERLPDESVVRGNECAPPSIPDLLGDLRRGDDVGEQHRDELGGPSPPSHAPESDGGSSSGQRHAAYERTASHDPEFGGGHVPAS